MIEYKIEKEEQYVPEPTQQLQKMYDLSKLPKKTIPEQKYGKLKLEYAPKCTYYGRVQNHKKNGRGELTLPNNDKYIGKFKDDLFDGKGVYIWANGDQYEGDFKNGKMEGSAYIAFQNGDIYEGGVRNGKKDGPGVYKCKKMDSVYSGMFSNDQCSGSGVWENQFLRYDGYFKFDKKEGPGIELYRSDLYKMENPPVKYVGNFTKGEINGFGKKEWKDSLTYEGNFVKGKREGTGKLTLHNTEGIINIKIFEGNFKDDKISDGKGSLIWGVENKEKNKYEGEFKNKNFNGQGKLSKITGETYEGNFVDGKYHGKGKLTKETGEKYEGNFNMEVYDGEGDLLKTDGEHYVGHFKNGDYDGFGKCDFTDG